MRVLPGLLRVAIGALAATAATAQNAPASTHLTGHVFDVRREPIRAARVKVYDLDDNSLLAVAATDGEGMYFVPRLPPRTGYRVRAEAKGLAAASLNTELGACNLELKDGATLRGTLRIDDVPVANAHVHCLHAHDGDDLRLEATTDAAGQFVLRNVKLGYCYLAAWSSDVGLFSGQVDVLGDRAVVLAHHANESVLRIEVTGLPDRVEPTLRVTTDRRHWDHWFPPQFQHVPMPGHTLTIRHLPHAEYTFRVAAPGYEFSPEVEQLSGTPAESHLVFAAAPSRDADRSPVRIVLVDNAARPVAGVDIAIARQGRHDPLLLRSDAEGVVTLPPQPDGTRMWAAVPDGAWALVPGPQAEELQLPLTRREFTTGDTTRIELMRAETLQGKVVDADNQPAAGERVDLIAWTADGRHGMFVGHLRSGTDGTFCFGGLQQGPWQYRLTTPNASGHASHASNGTVVTRFDQPIELRIAPMSIVEGVVREADGRPRPDAVVMLQDTRVSTDPSVVQVLSDCRGRYRICAPLTGEYVLQGPHPSNPVHLELKPGSHVHQDVVRQRSN